MSISYIIDPFFQFRVHDNAYMLNERFVAGGLIKNYDYDTLILGSSMTQNFDMNLFRNSLGVKPLHIGLGGATSQEITELMTLAYKTGKAEHYYVCVDWSAFTTFPAESNIPPYLLKNDFLSKIQYLLSYEPWFRYMPTDLGLLLIDCMDVELPLKFKYSRSIDKLGNWELDYTFGEDVVLENYKTARFAVSEVDTENLYNRMKNNIDEYLREFNFEKGDHIFFFPPYSSLYWCDTQNNGYYDDYLQAKEYFIEKASAYGAQIYDFQCAEFTTHLDNYKDTTHYKAEINDWMVDCFASKDYLVTNDNVNLLQEKLQNNTITFRQTYPDLFNN